MGSDGHRARECRGCGAAGLQPFLSLGEMPLANALLAADQLDHPEPTYPLEVAVCGRCCLAQLTVSVPPEALFSDYLYLSSYSQTVVDNAGMLVDRLVRDWRLGPDDLAMEIASNDGYLLAHYLRHGVPVLGIDPARNIAPVAEERGVETLCAFFGVEVAAELRAGGRRARVLHANNVLAHVPDVNGVLAGVATVLRDDGVAVIETPWVCDLVDNVEFDTIYHEHVYYYSLTALAALLGRNGLDVVDVERIPMHGGSLRVFAALDGAAHRRETVDELLDEERRRGADRPRYYEQFAERVQGLRDDLAALMADLDRQGSAIAAYGASAKGTVLLNAIGPAGRLPRWVADRNPSKQGRWVPGVRVPVVPPERILADQPDHLLVTVWNMLDEIAAQETAYLERGGRFIVPVPRPHLR